jgi:predicted lysophospholipase L1 biosynthesis ABC-type transport system permease subunit
VLPGGAVGERFRIDGDGDDFEWTIAGVVGDVRHFGLAEPTQPMIYFPTREDLVLPLSLGAATLVVRSTRAPSELAAEVRQAIHALDPTVPLTTVRSMKDVVSASTARQSFTMSLMAVAGTLAFLLGGVGVYGVSSYMVGQRTREIGVRMAVGARPERVQAMIVRQGVTVALLGVALGTAAALAATRLMTASLYGVSATDPMTFALVPIGLLAIAAVACWLPAQRASRIDPVRALTLE